MTDVFSILRNDHRHVEDLLTRLGDSEPGAERDSLVRELTDALRLHMRFEEEELYPPLAELDAESAEEADIEHRLAREGLDKLAELAAAPGFGAAVEMLTGGIGHHVQEEEQEIFPKLRDAFDAGRIDRLGATLKDDEGGRRSAGLRPPHRHQGRAARHGARRRCRRAIGDEQGPAARGPQPLTSLSSRRTVSSIRRARVAGRLASSTHVTYSRWCE